MNLLIDFIQKNELEIHDWINHKLKQSNAFFYSSCDIRYDGIKITQVDSNCFPAGFNNLSENSIKKIIAIYTHFFNQNNVKNVLIYPEFHTRNIGYLKNLHTLKNIFEQSGVNTKIASNQNSSYKLNIDEKVELFYEEIENINGIIKIKNSNFTPDLIISNNDFSLECPEILKNIKIKIIPSYEYGWHKRLKTNHCRAYNEVVKDFADYFKIDPWLLSNYFSEISNIDFKNLTDVQSLQFEIENLHNKIIAKYQEYKINKNPTIFIKSNKGTYGMGIHIIKNLDEIKNFNKKIRNKLDVIRDGIKNTSVILQEGVETCFTKMDKAVEPVFYSALSKPVGMFFRINTGSLSNLNSSGVEFSSEYKITKNEELLINLIGNLTNIANSKELTF